MIPAALSLLWLLALSLPGIAALARALPFLTPLERLAYGSVVGIVVGTLALLPLGIVAGGLSVPVVVGVGIVAVLIALALWLRSPAGAREAQASLRTIRPFGWVARLDLWGSVLFTALAVRWAFLWTSALQLGPDGLFAGHEYIWSDWPTHLGIVTRFAWGDNFPPQNTLYAGLPLSYHYLSDLTPAAFVTLGMDPTAALPLHSYVLSIIAALCLWAFVRRLSLRTSVATLATILFLFGAGIGWLPTLQTLDQSHDLIGTLLTAPFDAKAAAALHLRFFNPYLAFLMSQRAYLYGLPIAILMITVLVTAVRRRELRLFVVAGVVGGLLPLSHLPTLLAMALTTPFLVILLTPRPWRDPLHRIPWVGWIAFFAVWVAVAMPQLLTQLGGGTGALAAARIEVGWVASPDPWWWFWLKNLGLFIPLALVGLASARVLPPRSRAVVLSLMPIFIIANIAVFQPWDWDNHKILIYWFLGVTIVVAALLVDVWRSVRARLPGWPARAVTVRGLLVVAVLTMIGAPLLENLDQLEGHMRFGMLDAEQIQVAADVRDVAGPHDIVVTGMQAQDPVMMLSGRQLLMGYWGQLWVSGIPYQARQAEVDEIYKLTPAGIDAIRKYHVAFVVVGPDERSSLGASDAAFAARFPIAAQTANWRIYDVRGLWS
jgi:hypothetical protein